MQPLEIIRSILTIFYNLIKLFPRVFAGFLGFIPVIGTVLKFLPEILSFIEVVKNLFERGMTEIEIKKKVESISKALDNPDRVQSARELNDVFRT